LLQVIWPASVVKPPRHTRLRVAHPHQQRNISTMATAKKASAKTAPKKFVAKAPNKSTAKKPAPAAVAPLKPIKVTFNKTSLLAHVAQTSGQEPKVVRAVLVALESTLLASINKKGAGEFIWPGVVKVTALQVPAKKARKGIDPFTKVERMFAAKPASVKVKARFFKKVKDAAV
jgi:hypothetical protein